MDNAVLQEAEIEVLKSIFMEDFETVSSRTAWKSVNAAQEFRILVHPAEEGLKGKVRVRIHFKLPQRYPKAAPSMTFEDSVGLSTAHLSALATRLSALSHSLLGTEGMIYEICALAASFITDQNSVNGPSTSLGDQRLAHDALSEKQRLRKREEEERRREKEQREEAERVGKIIEEGRKGRGRGEEEREDEKDEVEEGLRVRLKDGREGAVVLAAGEVVDGLGVSIPGAIMVGADPPIAITAHIFDILSPFFLTSQAKRKLSKITSSLSLLLPLSTPTLHPILGYTLRRYSPLLVPSSSPTKADGYTLLVFAPALPSPSQSLSALLATVGHLPPERASALLLPIVRAMQGLHDKGIVHRGLKGRSVLVDQEAGETRVRVREAGWYQDLKGLERSNPWCRHAANVEDDDLPELWTCPEAVEEPFVYNKTRDMWDVGVLFAQMLFGLDVVKQHRTPGDLIKGLSRSSVRTILADLLSEEAKRRSSASSIISLLLSPSPTLRPTPSFPTSTSLQQLPLPKPPVDSSIFYQPRPSGSRYKAEFEELEFLGRGGGGQVVKARNRLDGHLYAVKKIRLPEVRSSEEKILREVTIWSRMNHPNIVRYHTSWVETELATHSSDDTDASTTEPSTQPPPSSLVPSSDEASSEDEEEPSEFDSDSDRGDLVDLEIGGVDPADFLSVGHSFPSIHFGKEGDPDTPPLTRGGSSPVLDKKSGREEQRPKSVRTLYIQMEYVEKLTLKEAIEEGESEVDSWRHMFQILSAMLHFTSLNIIHRDLKPSNIFLDVNGDVRIGDFGLAVNQGLADPADTMLSFEASIEETDLTSGVGTSLYIAPETLSRGRNDRSVKYSNKIDMYSLGIVFFELWHPFKTGMERIQVLRDLRKPEIIFPPTWDKVRLQRHTKIVQSCLVHDPELRASPKDLLNSDLLPPRVGDDSIEETIRLLSHSGTQHAQTLITALFNQTDDDITRKDFSYDFYDGEGAKVDNDPYGELVRDKLSRIFRQKGAVCMDSPLLMPQSHIYGARKPVRLLDADGTIACLPFHLNIPFCRMVARDTSLTRLKRWTIAPIYRSAPAGGQPRAVLNAAFDIVTDAHTAAAESECLYVADEIMSSFPFPGETIHYINHAKILNAVVEKVSPSRRPAVLEILVQHGVGRRAWSKTAQDLLKIHGVTRTIVDEIGTLDTPGSLADVQAKVFAAPRSGSLHVLKDAFAELQEVVVLSKRLGIRNIKVAPLLATDWDFHRDGVIFETHHVRSKTRSVIMTGGRFDDVVARLAAPEVRYSGRYPHVVGFSLAVAQLSLAAAEDANSSKALLIGKNEALRNYGPWAVRRCDVYVVSFSKDLIEQRLEIVKDLWKAGIKADLMYDDDFLNLTPDQLVRVCRGEGIMYLVFVKDRRIDPENTLRVKSVLRGVEEDVGRAELPSWFSKHSAFEDRNVSGVGAFESLAETPSAHSEPLKPTQEFFPILEDVRHKGKHKQRTMIIHRAQKNVEATAHAALEAPVFAADVDGQAFQLMSKSTAWLTDDEVYRAVVQSAPPSKREYLNQIRQTILSQRVNRQPPLTTFWLFSLREDRSSFLSFGDS